MISTVPDSRGIDALSGDIDDNVAPLIFDQLFTEMASQFPVTPIDLGFPEEPWRQLPTVKDLQYLWLTSSTLEMMIADLAIAAGGGQGDVPKFIARQRWLADMELALKKEVPDDTAPERTDDGGGSGAAATVAAAGAQRGGGDFPGGSEDGDTVGAGGQDSERQDVGQAPPVSRKRGAGKAARG